MCFSRAFWASSRVRNLKTPRGYCLLFCSAIYARSVMNGVGKTLKPDLLATGLQLAETSSLSAIKCPHPTDSNARWTCAKDSLQRISCGKTTLLLCYEEHIPSPASYLRALSVFHFRSIAKLISKRISSLGLFIVTLDFIHV